VNETWFKVPAGKEGVYRGQCAELCGPNHADMRAWVRAVKPSEFEAWARSKRAQIKAAGEELGRARKERLKAGEVD
jgi:cytochrome c oxidase subunit 2